MSHGRFYITTAASRPTQTLSFSAISLIMESLKRPHAVVVPFPAQGHINPCMQLAKLLHSRGFYISFVNTEFNHSRLVRSKGPDFVKGLQRFHFEVMPDGLPPSDRDATQDVWALCDSVRKNCLGPFRELLAKLNSSTSWPPVTCIISDGIMSFAVKAAEELRIPEVQFWTASACGFMGYLQFSELINRGIVPFKDEKFLSDHSFLDTSIDWIPGMSNIRLKDIPSFIRTTDREDIMLNFMSDEAQNCLQSPAIIFNTLDDFEHQLLEAIAAKFPRIYTVGPLSLLEKQMPECEAKSLRCSLWKEDSECLEWLDRQDPDSVVYVSYGCITVMSDQQLQEFAWGLASSKYPFLWVVRPDAVMGSSAILPEEYYEEIKHRGLLVSWCPQEQVLCHPSVGVFITHCGWNSVLESICGAKPVICWPFFAEQLTNCRYLCGEWGIGLEINREVKREEIRSLVEEVIEGEKGKQMKKKALDWKKKAEEATVDGGSSHLDFDRFIKEALQYDN